MSDFSNPAIIAAFVAAGAAVLTALVSALFNLSIARKVASQKLAEMRQIWIEDLRSRMADFLGCTHRILNQCSPNKDHDQEKLSQELRELNAELVRLEEYISMKLNHEEEAHRRLVNVIACIRGATVMITAGNLSPVKHLEAALAEANELSRYIFKTEWDRASDEVKPVGRLRRRSREKKMRERLTQIQDRTFKFFIPTSTPKE